MFRAAICDLKNWQTKPKRKPLVVRGARQVGKTYLIRQFGHECFRNTVELNFRAATRTGTAICVQRPQPDSPVD